VAAVVMLGAYLHIAFHTNFSQSCGACKIYGITQYYGPLCTGKHNLPCRLVLSLLTRDGQVKGRLPRWFVIY